MGVVLTVIRHILPVSTTGGPILSGKQSPRPELMCNVMKFLRESERKKFIIHVL